MTDSIKPPPINRSDVEKLTFPGAKSGKNWQKAFFCQGEPDHFRGVVTLISGLRVKKSANRRQPHFLRSKPAHDQSRLEPLPAPRQTTDGDHKMNHSSRKILLLLLLVLTLEENSQPAFGRQNEKELASRDTGNQFVQNVPRRSFGSSYTPVLDALQRERVPGSWRYNPTAKPPMVGFPVGAGTNIAISSPSAPEAQEVDGSTGGLLGSLLGPFNIMGSLNGTQKQLRDLQSPIRQLREPIADLHAPISSLTGPLSDLKDPMVQLRQPIENLREPLTGLRQPMEDLKQPLSDLRSPMQDLKNPISDLKGPINELRGPVSELKAPLYMVERSTKALTPSLNGVSNSLDSMRQPIGKLYAPIDKLHKPLSDIAGPLGELGAPMNGLPKPLNELTASTTELTNEVGSLRKQLGSLQNSIESIASNISYAVIFGSLMVCLALFLHRRIPSATAPTRTTVESIDDEQFSPDNESGDSSPHEHHHVTVMTTEPVPESELKHMHESHSLYSGHGQQAGNPGTVVHPNHGLQNTARAKTPLPPPPPVE